VSMHFPKAVVSINLLYSCCSNDFGSI
jgi:hypothetical protein